MTTDPLDVAARRLERRKAERNRKNDARLRELRARLTSEAHAQGVPLVEIGPTNSGGLYVTVGMETGFASTEGFAMKRVMGRLREGERYRLVVERLVDGARRLCDLGVRVAERRPPSPRRALAERFAGIIAASGATVGLTPEVLLYDDHDRGYRCSFSTYPREILLAPHRPGAVREDGLVGWVLVERPDAVSILASHAAGGRCETTTLRFSGADDAEAALRLLLADRDFAAFRALRGAGASPSPAA